MDENTPVTNPAAAVRLARILKVAFLLSGFLFLFVVLQIPARSPQPVDPTVEMVITILALSNVVLGFVFPRFLLKSAQRSSGTTLPATPSQRWLTGNVIGFAFIEACSLFGVTLHFLGAELWRSELLIGAGIVATVFFSPGNPPLGEGGSSTQS